jgi:hypothetical protein
MGEDSAAKWQRKALTPQGMRHYSYLHIIYENHIIFVFRYLDRNEFQRVSP